MNKKSATKVTVDKTFNAVCDQTNEINKMSVTGTTDKKL